MGEIIAAHCPLCLTSHGNKATHYADPKSHRVMARLPHWEWVLTHYDPNKEFAFRQETHLANGQRNMHKTGNLTPEQVPQHFTPMRTQLLRVIHDWVARGWLTQEEVTQAILGLEDLP